MLGIPIAVHTKPLPPVGVLIHTLYFELHLPEAAAGFAAILWNEDTLRSVNWNHSLAIGLSHTAIVVRHGQTFLFPLHSHAHCQLYSPHHHGA